MKSMNKLGCSRNIYWLQNGCQHPMVRWKIKCRKRHVFDIRFLSSVVLPSLENREVSFREQNEILGVDVTLFSFFAALTSFVELRLQVSTSIVSCVIRRVGHVTPARRQAECIVMFCIIEHVLLFSRLGLFVCVGIHAKDKPMSLEGAVRRHGLYNSINNRFRCQPIRISMERSDHKLDIKFIGCGDGQNVAFRNGNRDTFGKRIFYQRCYFNSSTLWKRFLLQENDRVLVSDSIQIHRSNNMEGLSQFRCPGLIDKGGRNLLEGNDVGIGIRVLQNCQCMRNLLLVEIFYHCSFQALPDVRG
mmetsp:Transcript_18376/g.29618  ORF Transcript_18376/g.29618 Transcript_18376/m.29618 type:complete len:303 (+) Transcript_18376:138-1046(+)